MASSIIRVLTQRAKISKIVRVISSSISSGGPGRHYSHSCDWTPQAQVVFKIDCAFRSSRCAVKAVGHTVLCCTNSFQNFSRGCSLNDSHLQNLYQIYWINDLYNLTTHRHPRRYPNQPTADHHQLQACRFRLSCNKYMYRYSTWSNEGEHVDIPVQL